MDRTIDGRYRILAELGSGGMGTVFKVEDQRDGRVLALKVLAADGERTREKLLRFRREFRAASSLVHPNVVRVHEFVSGRVSYFTMEYFAGAGVAAYFGVDEPRPPRAAELNAGERQRKVLSVLHQVLLALAFVHDRRIVHRDLKPENILVGEVHSAGPGSPACPLVKLMDFGLARDLRETTALTQPGVVLGTLAYISPEQATGRPVDGRADLYALGVVLYKLLTGTVPFATDTVSSILWKHCAQAPEPPRIRNPSVNRLLENICLRLLRKDPFERFQTAAETLRAVERAARGTYDLPPDVVLHSARAERTSGPLFAPRLVGRDAELHDLLEAVESARAGRSSLRLLWGPAGAGKSRLLEAALDGARTAGARVAAAGFTPGRRGPYGGLVPLLEELVAIVRTLPLGETAPVLLPHARALRELVPSARDLGALRRTAEDTAGTLAAPLGRAPIAVAVAALVLAAGLRSPLVLALEDLEHADEASLAVLAHLVRTSLARPGTPEGAGKPEGAGSRDTEATRAGDGGRGIGRGDPGILLLLTALDPAPAAVLAAGLDTGFLAVAIAPLGLGQTTLLVQSMLGQDLGSDAASEVLFRASGGLPLFVEETTRRFAAEGVLRWESGRWQVDLARLLRAAPPYEQPPGAGAADALRADVRRRAAEGSAAGRALLEAAAVLARPVRFELLARAAAVEEAEGLDAVEELLRARLLAEERGEGELACAHELVREAVLEALDPGRRAAVAGAALGALEDSGEPMGSHGELEALAFAEAAGDASRARLYRESARERLARLGEPQDR